MTGKEVKTDTIYEQVNNDGNLTITIQETGYTPNVVTCKINDNPDSNFLNNKEIKVGELGVVLKNALSDIDLFVELKTGELFVSGKDAANYSIDNDGNLIYTWK